MPNIYLGIKKSVGRLLQHQNSTLVDKSPNASHHVNCQQFMVSDFNLKKTIMTLYYTSVILYLYVDSS